MANLVDTRSKSLLNMDTDISKIFLINKLANNEVWNGLVFG